MRTEVRRSALGERSSVTLEIDSVGAFQMTPCARRGVHRVHAFKRGEHRAPVEHVTLQPNVCGEHLPDFERRSVRERCAVDEHLQT